MLTVELGLKRLLRDMLRTNITNKDRGQYNIVERVVMPHTAVFKLFSLFVKVAVADDMHPIGIAPIFYSIQKKMLENLI